MTLKLKPSDVSEWEAEYFIMEELLHRREVGKMQYNLYTSKCNRGTDSDDDEPQFFDR